MACAVHRRLLEEYGAGPDHRFLLKIPHSLFNSEDVDASNAPTSNVVNETTDRFYNIFSDRFWLGRIDLRPLGLMRVVFGAVLFWSTIDLAPVLRAFFSDDGVVPRAALLAIARNNRVSVFDFSGPPWLLVGMYALTLAAIMAFTVGFRSRLASVATFVLVTGLHERNTYALDGSDNVLRVMLFWMMFMPVGARYSFDALARDARGEPTMTHGMAMPIRLGQLQIAWVYLNTVLYKWPGVAWHDGTALRIALGLDHMFVRRPGQLLFHQRPLVALGTHATIYVELLFLPLVFLPLGRPLRGWLSRWPAWLFQPTWKALAIASCTAMHLAIAVLMRVGNFSYIMISTYFLLFEPEWTEPLVRFVERRRGWQAFVAAVSARLARVEVARPAMRAPADASGWASRLRARATFAFQAVALPFLMLQVMWFSLPEGTKIPSVAVTKRVRTPHLDLSPSRMWAPASRFVEELELWQRWNMFSPKPLDRDVYLMGRGELSDGTPVDVLRGDRGNGGALLPPVTPGFFFTRWTKYLSNVVTDQAKDSPWVMGFARYVCKEWNTDVPAGRAPLGAFKLYREVHRTTLFDEAPADWVEEPMWEQRCLEPSAAPAVRPKGPDRSEGDPPSPGSATERGSRQG